MAELSTLPPLSQKRPHEDDIEPSVSTPTKVAIRSEASTPLSVLSVHTPSPMKSLTPSTTAPSSSVNPLSSQSVPASSTGTQQPAKRRKLTQQEKDDQKAEKEAKAKAREDKKAQKEAEDKLKAEQKAAREEEKRVKDEEKRIKDEEKQKRTEEREEKRRQKEEEQQQKEEEKAKKERSQMRLGAFFAKPKGAAVTPSKALVESTPNIPASSASLLSDLSGAITTPALHSPQKNFVQNSQSDYEKYFLPFNLMPHTILAPTNAFMEDPAKMYAARTRLDNIAAQANVQVVTVNDLKETLPSSGRRGVNGSTVVDVVECVNGTSDQPIDLTEDKLSAHTKSIEMLKSIPMKYIHFGEDVRPPYYGTYTRPYTDTEAARLARNPTSRLRTDTNYDYDSEAEWDEPEEGEDLGSEGEDEEDEAEDDMDGFLDDEEDPQLKRRLISGDLQPVSTGLCWQDEQGVSRLNDGSDAICTDFRDFSMGFLLPSQPHAIDPFSTAYWAPEPALVAAPIKKEATANGSMNPPRAPLTQRTVNGLINTLNTPQQQAPGSASKPAKAKRMIPPEHMSAFKTEVQGKDLTKIGMVEALKKVFPKIPKDAITNTLSVVAARVGPTEKEKRWVLVGN